MTALPEQIYALDGAARVIYIRSDLVVPEHASNETGSLGKGLPNDPENVPEKESIGIQAALAEAIEFGEQDAQALTPSGEAMVQRWRDALAEPIPRWDGWRSIDTAPEDQHVILCTSGGHVGEAIMLVDEDTGQQKWAWALGPLHPNHIPYGWRPLPDALNAPVASDLRSGGFDGPTGAE